MKPSLKIFILFFAVFFLASCSIVDIKKQSKHLESISHISGSIEDNTGEYPVYVMLLKQLSTHAEVINHSLLNDNDEYQFNVFPGSYIVIAYVDENMNGKKDKIEKPALYSEGASLYKIIKVDAEEHIILKGIYLRDALDIGEQNNVQINLNKAQSNIGKVVSLDDDIFSKENTSLGFWKPLTFLNNFGGGLFMLQEYEVKKIPIVFIHGISGSPTEFRSMIQTLDRDKYQPWVLYYPTGIQLDLISHYLLNALNKLKEQHGFTNVYLITHSMGGLMSRSFLMKHEQQKAEFDVSFYMTINSPLYGMESAASGVNSSPIVIASWRDLAAGSDYIKKVHDWHMPSDIAYHLVFSYLSGSDGDGVVPMSSQLSLSLQDEATQIYGFQLQHAQILKEDDFIQRFNRILSKHIIK